MKSISLKIALIFASFILLIPQTKAQNFSKIDTWLKTHTDVMGGRLYLIVYKDGKVVYSHAENDLNLNNKATINYFSRLQGKNADLGNYTADTKQQIASCSKWLSAALIMTFIDEGKLKLTDSVGKFLPALTKAGKGKITISQCLSHLTAIKAPSLMESLNQMKTNNSMDDAINQIAALPMEGSPGKVFRYSNVGLQIAGAVIEKISGKIFESLFAERIAKPLNMKNTDFGHGKVALPAGGASSTPTDYINFLTMILNKGLFNGKRILSENSIKEMQINRLTTDVRITHTPAEAGGFGYGFGEWIMDGAADGNSNHSISSPGLFGSFPWVNNQNKTAGFLMAFHLNNKGRNEYYLELKNLVNEALRQN